MQNDNSKLKINKIQIPVIARSGATKQSPSFRRVIASYPEVSGDEAIPKMNYKLLIIN